MFRRSLKLLKEGPAKLSVFIEAQADTKQLKASIKKDFESE